MQPNQTQLVAHRGAEYLGVLSMTSHEIVEVAESIGASKRHDHVLRDVRVMLLELHGGGALARLLPEHSRGRFLSSNADRLFDEVFEGSPTLGQLVGKAFSFACDARGRISQFRLDREHTLALVTGYDVKLRKRIIDRLTELEMQFAANALPAPTAAPASEPVAQVRDTRVADLSLQITYLNLAASAVDMSRSEHIAGLEVIGRRFGMPAGMLPPKTETTFTVVHCPTYLLGERGSCLTAEVFYRLAEEQGIVSREWRFSTKKNHDGTKSQEKREYWAFTQKGIRYGRDEMNSHAGGRESAPLFYDERFAEVLKLISPDYERIVASGEFVPRWPKSENPIRAKLFQQRHSKDHAVRERAKAEWKRLDELCRKRRRAAA